MFNVGEMPTSFEKIENELEEPSRMAFARKVMDEGVTLIKDENHLLPVKENEKI